MNSLTALSPPAWVDDLFSAIDRKDATAFGDFFARQGIFHFANSEPLQGSESIVNAVASFFTTLRALRHEVVESWSAADVIILRGQVTYTRLSGTELTVPFVNIIKFADDKVQEYQIFVDNSAL